MNQPTKHPSDETLSAHLDGGGAGAPRQTVEAHLASCEHCGSRIQAFRAVATAVREAGVEPVDEVTRRRLVGRAVQAGAAPRRTPAMSSRLRALAVAAVAVVAVGTAGGVVLLRDDEPADDAVAAGLPIESEHVAGGDAALDDPGSLEGLLVASEAGDDAGAEGFSAGGGPSGAPASGGAESELRQAESSAEADEAAPSAEPSDSAASGEARTSPAAAASAPPVRVLPTLDDLAAIARCYRSLASAIPEDSRLTAAATGRYQGARVVVLGFRASGDRLLAMVLARSDCSIVTAESFGR